MFTDALPAQEALIYHFPRVLKSMTTVLQYYTLLESYSCREADQSAADRLRRLTESHNLYIAIGPLGLRHSSTVS